MDPTQPFALLHDNATGGARLFTGASGIIRADRMDDVRPALAAMRAAIHRGEWLAGGIGYMCGHALEPRLAGIGHPDPCLWFGRFGPPQSLSAEAVTRLLATWARPVRIGRPRPLIDAHTYETMVARIQNDIAAGDIYQANLTFQCTLPLSGHPLALFARLRRLAHAPHAALVHAGGGRWWLSLSPELFFTLDQNQLTARPMKGTAPRHADAQTDRAAARALAADPKNRAENLMIADLLRNDLSRVAVPGSVRAPKLLTVETYPSVHQMTSTITARRAAGTDALDILTALFPCGSITGAPKIRAMEILAALEPHPRGIYCGGIGWIGPGGNAAHFNVAIRTISFERDEARIGLGSGIVADSVAADEWRECLLKAEFLHPASPSTLIETMRREADGRVPLLPLHLARMARSAARFGFPFEPGEVAARIAALPPAGLQRLRLLLGESGAVALQLSPLPPATGPLAARFAPLPVPATDWRLQHKSNSRDFLDTVRRESGMDEVLFLDGEGFATQGSFTNIFVRQGDVYLTPPLSRGLLPGVLRETMLASGEAIEADLHKDSLCAAAEGCLFAGNALRGLMPVALAASRADA